MKLEDAEPPLRWLTGIVVLLLVGWGLWAKLAPWLIPGSGTCP